jgi:hypothetical protein
MVKNTYLIYIIFQSGSCGKAALQLRVKGATETLTITCSSVEVTIYKILTQSAKSYSWATNCVE